KMFQKIAKNEGDSVVRLIGINIDTKRLSGSEERLKEELEKFERLGFDCVEIPPAGLDVIFTGQIVHGRLNRITQVMKRSSLKFTVHGPDLVDLSSSRKEDLQILSATIDFASSIDALTVVYHCAWLGESAEKKRREIENLKRLCAKLEKTNVCLVVENTRQLIEQTLQVVTAVNHPQVKLLIDVGHLFLRVKGNEQKFLEQLSLGLSHAFELHVHDNFGKPVNHGKASLSGQIDFAYLYGLGDLHLPLGFGKIPFERVFELVRERFEGIIVLEINDLNRFERDIPETLEKLKVLSYAGGVQRA
ncbi:MAG: Xylose isomerase domain-containing protein TIM barrel, partial [Thermotoga sp. 50_1627]